MYSLETLAHHMANNLLSGVKVDTIQRAKVEYGLALVLGVLIELFLTLGVAFILGTTVYTLFIMLASLAVRIFTGGKHCTSFRRCLIFTMAIFIGASIVVKFSILNIANNKVILISLIIVLVSSMILIRSYKRFALILSICNVVLSILGLQISSEAKWLVEFTLSISIGIAIQAFMVHKLGQRLVLASDNFMQRFGI